MDIRILGTLDVRENGVSVVPTAPKPRQVLAVLALHADQAVTVGTLSEELWGRRPPRSARPTLQTYVMHLRDLIAPALRGAGDGAGARTAKEVLRTVPGGYLLDSGEGTSDVREFERIAGTGYRTREAGDQREAARLLRAALDLWQGPALADITAGEYLSIRVRALEESRLCALDQRIEADLRLGRHRELIPELTVLADRHPTHESLCGQLMLALHRSGRRSDALDAYRRLRTTLVRDQGLEPSAALGRIRQSVLSAPADGTPPPGTANPLARIG
ncbi:MAG: AfsR/SARP family transcriptional regulator [Streptomyces sp.]|uniref:AfsR/SARP family transcriptional regulator n=1 Tax=Streptomyces sp. TaxID=1931 RepID=UPI0025ED8057|nr:AfsR/SARP family transcriptional regulator [Streptomyces sp.]MBW8795092.1 AfsR/SARP family transcriptional regulator [Streptomyces sp.]